LPEAVRLSCEVPRSKLAPAAMAQLPATVIVELLAVIAPPCASRALQVTL